MAREITRKSWEKWRKIADELEYDLDDMMPKSRWTKAALITSQRNSRWIGNRRWVPFFEVTWWNAAAIARENGLPIWRQIDVAWNRKSICKEIESMSARDRFEDLIANWGHLAVA